MHLRARTDRLRSEIGRSSIACSSAKDVSASKVTGSSSGRSASELAEFQALRGQHLADFDQRRLAEVLAGQQFLLGGLR